MISLLLNTRPSLRLLQLGLFSRVLLKTVCTGLLLMFLALAFVTSAHVNQIAGQTAKLVELETQIEQLTAKTKELKLLLASSDQNASLEELFAKLQFEPVQKLQFVSTQESVAVK